MQKIRVNYSGVGSARMKFWSGRSIKGSFRKQILEKFRSDFRKEKAVLVFDSAVASFISSQVVGGRVAVEAGLRTSAKVFG